MATRKRVVEVARKRPAPKLESIKVLVLPDEDPDTSYLDQDDFDERREAYRRGDFTFVGMRAEAEVIIEGTVQTLASGGLWGIESDSGDEYFQEIAREEYNALRDVLVSVGVPTSQIPTSDRTKVRIEWRA